MSAALPKSFMDLRALLDEQGWTYQVKHGSDGPDGTFSSGGNRSLQLLAVRPNGGSDDVIDVHWHTRDHGTYRLVGCAIGRYSHRRDVSLRTARELVMSP